MKGTQRKTVAMDGRNIHGVRTLVSEQRGRYMRLMLRVVALAATIWAAQSASAVQTYTNATITEVTLNRAYGNFVAITVAGTPTGTTSCATGYANWNFTLSLGDAIGTNMYALLLTAVAEGKPVTLYGTDLCSEHAGVESLSLIQLPLS
jgi:hypothetical protein